MSVAGLQRTQQALNAIGRNFEGICQAAEMPGVDLQQFLFGTLQRAGIQPTAEMWTFIAALTGMIGPAGPATLPPGAQVEQTVNGSPQQEAAQ